jgi:selenocysteine lyase/cysteine desulfurase
MMVGGRDGAILSDASINQMNGDGPMESSKSRTDRRGFISRCVQGAALSSLPLGLSACASPDEARSPSLDEILPLAGKGENDTFWTALRTLFPLDPELIYMNNGGLGPSPHPVIDAMIGQMMDLEKISETGHHLVADVRRKASRFLGCGEEELAFTRSTTEGMNIIARGLPLKPGDEVLLSTHEHPGGAMPWLALAKDLGIEIRLFEPGSGGSDTLERISSSITSRTRVLSLSHVTCTTGLVVPVQRIASLCRYKGIISVFDGAQSAGMIPVNLHALGCDFYATSGHKWLLGPKGTGLLYIRESMIGTWRPTYVGAYSDREYDLDRLLLEYLPEARGTEYGTRNTPLVKGLEAALDFLACLGMNRVSDRTRSMAAFLKSRLAASGAVEVLTPMDDEASAAMVTFRPSDKSIKHHELVNRMKKKHNIRLRPVGEHGLDGVRVSLHIYNDFKEIDRLLSVLEAELPRA